MWNNQSPTLAVPIPMPKAPASKQRPSNVDRDGYRPNVGMVIQNAQAQVFWARRVGGHGTWQFPQGGILPGESAEQALYRELYEEVGLAGEAVQVRGRTKGWLRYRLPRELLGEGAKMRFRGQKQKWFLLRLLADDSAVRVDRTPEPEFDAWRWVSYWYPVTQVVAFKREVYRRALCELAPALALGA